MSWRSDDRVLRQCLEIALPLFDITMALPLFDVVKFWLSPVDCLLIMDVPAPGLSIHMAERFRKLPIVHTNTTV